MKNIINFIKKVRSWFCSHDFELIESYSGADLHISKCSKCGIVWSACGRMARKYPSRLTGKTKFFTLINGKWEQD